MQNRFELLPYVGAGPLRFGMKPMQVEELVGAPKLLRTTRSGRRDERRDYFTVLYDSKTNGVDEIEFFEEAEVFFKSTNILQDQANAFREMLLADGEPFESLGTIVLLNLGITLSAPASESKTTTVFTKGKWDPFLPNLVRFPLPK